MTEYKNKEIVISILDSLNQYEQSKDFSHLFTMGSKLSFVAYSIDKEDSLASIVPSLILFTEIIHRISLSDSLKKRFDTLIMAYLNDLKAWLENSFLDKKHHLVASNVIESLISNVHSIKILLEDKDEVSDLDDIFF